MYGDISNRRVTRPVMVGDVQIGGGAGIVVQSMLNAPQGDIEANLQQSRALVASGCQIIRLSISNEKDIDTIRALKKEIPVPLVADIQQNYKLALMSVEAGIDKVRINPKYIGTPENVAEVVAACKANGVAIRVGVNSGSTEQALIEKYGGVTPMAMAESAMNHVKILEDLDFHDIVISIKSSDIRTMIGAYKIVAEQCDYPLHVGLTEAGTARQGLVKSAIGIGALLAEGIGDTIRVSLTDDPCKEITAAHDILRALELLPDSPQLVSCPTCGRTQIDLVSIAAEVEERLKDVKKDIRVAVMGCPVNGPGEAKNADIGITGGNGIGIIFKGEQVIKKVPEAELIDELFKQIEEL